MRWITQALVSAVAAMSLVASSESNGPQPPPNILLIVLDDLGFEKLDWWPYQPFSQTGVTGNPPTPMLHALATEGIVFTNVWASPVCSPSRMQILTGRHSHRTGVGNVVGPDAPVDDTELLLPEVIRLGNPAYRTGAFGKWHIVPRCNRTHPTDNGFEIFQGHMLNVQNLGTG
jgi:arylsulfatase A-like enzyme